MSESFTDYLDRISAQISEQCPGEGVAVQILCSWTDPKGDTSYAYSGHGNRFARDRMADHFTELCDDEDIDPVDDDDDDESEKEEA